MSTDRTARTEITTDRSILPGALAGISMLGFAATRVIGLVFYDHDTGSTATTLVLGVAVYFITLWFQNWRAASVPARQR